MASQDNIVGIATDTQCLPRSKCLVHKMGFLRKAGEGWSRTLKRWFVQQDLRLFYFKNQVSLKDLETTPPVGVISLADAEYERLSLSSGSPAFVVRSVSAYSNGNEHKNRVFKFEAMSEGEMTSWLEALQRAQAMHGMLRLEMAASSGGPKTGSMFDVLPQEMLFDIFVKLNADTLTRSVSKTCRRWNETFHTSELWKELCVRDFSVEDAMQAYQCCVLLALGVDVTWGAVYEELVKIHLEEAKLLDVAERSIIYHEIMSEHAVVFFETMRRAAYVLEIPSLLVTAFKTRKEAALEGWRALLARLEDKYQDLFERFDKAYPPDEEGVPKPSGSLLDAENPDDQANILGTPRPSRRDPTSVVGAGSGGEDTPRNEADVGDNGRGAGSGAGGEGGSGQSGAPAVGRTLSAPDVPRDETPQHSLKKATSYHSTTTTASTMGTCSDGADVQRQPAGSVSSAAFRSGISIDDDNEGSGALGMEGRKDPAGHSKEAVGRKGFTLRQARLCVLRRQLQRHIEGERYLHNIYYKKKHKLDQKLQKGELGAKMSGKKKSEQLDFVATNLHLQQLAVIGEEPTKGKTTRPTEDPLPGGLQGECGSLPKLFYQKLREDRGAGVPMTVSKLPQSEYEDDLTKPVDPANTLALYNSVTVGAFAAHTLGFKDGGILQLLDMLDQYNAQRAAYFDSSIMSGPPRGIRDHVKIVSRIEVLRWHLEHRRSICLSQALTAIVTSFIAEARRKCTDQSWWHQIQNAGYLVCVTALLSTWDNEMGMLGDTAAIVLSCNGVRFRFATGVEPDVSTETEMAETEPSMPSGGDVRGSTAERRVPLPQISIDVNDGGVEVLVSLAPSDPLLYHIPEQWLDAKEGDSVDAVRIVAITFNLGINEWQFIAEKLASANLRMQTRINCEAVARLKQYFFSLARGVYGSTKDENTPMAVAARAPPAAMVDIEDGMALRTDVMNALAETGVFAVSSEEQLQAENRVLSNLRGGDLRSSHLPTPSPSLNDDGKGRSASIAVTRTQSAAGSLQVQLSSTVGHASPLTGALRQQDQSFAGGGEVEGASTHENSTNVSPDASPGIVTDGLSEDAGTQPATVAEVADSGVSGDGAQVVEAPSDGAGAGAGGAATNADAAGPHTTPIKVPASDMDNSEQGSPLSPRTKGDKGEKDKDKSHVQHDICAVKIPTATKWLSELMRENSGSDNVDDKLKKKIMLLAERLDAIEQSVLQGEGKKDERSNRSLAILEQSSDWTRMVDCGRITMCKSAKDRTSMFVTAEQARLIVKPSQHNLNMPGHGVDATKTKDVVDIMRTRGTRIFNVQDNVGQQKYAFNKLQVQFLPELYRPPQKLMGWGTKS